MENFIVSARKYRPATFDTVVGQSHITTTLKNALKNNHLAQAFLFCGPRGVGKTTCARILAKTINCLTPTPDFEACGTCESCIAFQKNGSMNVYELDAASNNSVDDIRNLVEQVRFPPQMGKRKVYIVDEVHMLSTSAFNAFLKTLEEPPSYVIFILATTEKHKIIPTILSRCQIFDFKRIEVKDIALHLQNIAQKEHIPAEYDALELIAQKADGGLRDALSLFDMLSTFGGSNGILYQTAIENLHILDYDYYFKVTDALVEQNIGKALLIFQEILSKGFDGHNFIVGLQKHLRDLLVCKDNTTLQLLEVSEKVKSQYAEQSKKTSLSFLISALHLTNQCDIHYKSSKNPKVHIEITLIKIAHINALVDWDNVKETESPEKKKPIAKVSISQNYVVAQDTNGKVQETLAQPYQSAVSNHSNPKISFDLNEIKKSVLENTAEKQSNVAQNQAFSLEQLREAIEHFKKVKKDVQLDKILNRLPEMNEGFELLFKLEESQTGLFEQYKEELRNSLRKRLQNQSINFKTTLLKVEEPKPASNYQKFEFLAKEYPTIELLKERLDLEVDF